MKKLGLIGGTGPESTIIYYKKIVYGANEKVGREFFPNISIESINVFDVLRFCSEKRYDDLSNYILKAIHNLVESGCDVVSLTGNTPHIVFEALQEKSPVPLISIIKATQEEASVQGLKKIGLLGTRFTMEEDFFKKPFRDVGIEVVAPKGKDLNFIAEKIASELEHGIVRQDTKAGFLKVIENLMIEEKIDSVALGCTELPLIFDGLELPIPCLDTLEIHSRALLSAMELSS